uniref:Vitamin K epoxide reductase domain-containing protein n=1 Tax=uncultured marine group II/III euryarchaeote KM3_31_G10 TaxID=1456433 RepID=A0A075H440_9EURY|nr:hypothetical protein [uncultured marine group II/III euryarchaeote KM3_31_G10]
MAISTIIVTLLSLVGVLFGLATRLDSVKPHFNSLGLSSVSEMPAGVRMLLGTLTSIAGGVLVSIWVWVIQRQTTVGVTDLCAPESGCAVALSDSAHNIIPFTNLGYGIFFILWFSIIGFLALSLYLDPKLSGGGRFLAIGRLMSLGGTVIAVVMLVSQLALIEGGPVICLLCLILVASNAITFALFHKMDEDWSSNSFES